MLSRETARKIVKLLPMLASDQDGEVASAARATSRALAADGLDWHDLAQILFSRAAGGDMESDRFNPAPPYANETPPKESAEDRRSKIRYRKVLLAGKILLPNGGIIDCKLRNRSEEGALLQLASLIGVPDEFVLRVPSTNEIFGVKTIWRGEGEIGVRRM